MQLELAQKIYDIAIDYRDVCKIPYPDSFDRQEYKRHTFYNSHNIVKVMVCDDLWKAYTYLCEQGKS